MSARRAKRWRSSIRAFIWRTSAAAVDELMKIILSRKGFDSSSGGVPSPIFPQTNGLFSLYSLPIPLERATCRYKGLRWNGVPLDEISSLRGRKAPLSGTPHLDPDLAREALRYRHPDWRPIFGQSGRQETQLRKMGVDDPGDLCDRGSRPVFLFFGWYRMVRETSSGYSYVRSAPNLHAFFGWLQVERKVVLSDRTDRNRAKREMPWAAHHPHVACDYYDGKPNAIYIAPRPGSETDSLILDGHDTGLPASGMFRRYLPEIHTLTAENKTRRCWRLPAWFHRDGYPKLGMHMDVSRWKEIPNDPDHVELRSVDRGQEFVFDSHEHDEGQVRAWVELIVRSGQP